MLELNVGEMAREGEGLEAGQSAILTFHVGGPKKRSDPITITGKATNLGLRINLPFPEDCKTLSVELHKIIGENKTRVIGKGSLNTGGPLLPRMSGGREAAETVELKGTLKGGVAAKHRVSLKLQLRELQEGEEEGDAAINRRRILQAMKRQDERAVLRSKVEGSLRQYELRKRGGERPFVLDSIRAYNLPETLSTAEGQGTVLRVTSGPHGLLSRHVAGTRHPGFAQSLSLPGAGAVDLVLEDRGFPYTKYGAAPLPIKELKVGSSYLADLVLDDNGTRLLSVISAQHSVQEHFDRFSEDQTLQYLQVEVSPLMDFPVVVRMILCGAEDDLVADWHDADDHDAELEAVSIRIAADGEDEEAFAAIKELDEEKEEDGVVEQLTSLTATGAALPNAPSQRSVGFSAKGMGQRHLLIELFTPEVPERDEDTNVEGESDTPGMSYLAACMIPLEEVANAKPTVLNPKKKNEISYRQLHKVVEMRVNEDISELLPNNVQLPRDFTCTLRLWEASVISQSFERDVKGEEERRLGFDSWLKQLKLVTVEELLLSDAKEAIKENAYELAPQQTDHVLPDVDKKTFETVDHADRLAYPHSVPSTPTQARVREARRRPRTQEVPRRLGRPEVPTRPVTPVTYTKEQVDAMIARAVAQAEERMRNRNLKERQGMEDRIDVLTASIRQLTEDKKRFQEELDERSEAIRKCGIEIMELRKKTKQLAADKSQVQQHLNEREAATQNMLQVDDNLEMLDRGDLEKRLKLLSGSYKEERAKGSELLQRMQSVHAQLQRTEELSRAHAGLQEAHQAQSTRMQQLQEKNNRLAKYVTTVQQQEQVIEKLEDMMERALTEAREAKGLKEKGHGLEKELKKVKEENSALQARIGADAATEAAKDQQQLEQLNAKVAAQEAEIKRLQQNPTPEANKELEDKLKALQAEKEDLEKRLSEAEKKPRRNPDEQSSEKERLMLLMRAEKAESRIKAVENQLQVNSKRFAKEISGLKLKLMEAGVKA